MESECGSGTNVKHPRRNTKANGNMGEVRHPLGDSKDEIGNGWHPRIHEGIPVSERIVAPAKRLKSFSSGSSSASDILSEDFIQVDQKLIKPRPPLPIHHKTDSYSDTSSKSVCDSRLSICDSLQVSGITHESLSQRTSMTESPPIQVMERPTGFDPNRIPPSVFVSKSPSPMDWSIASNDSLFSIHIGNNSPSRDRVLKLSGEIHKSGELEKTGNSYKPTATFSPSPVPQRKENDSRKCNLGRDFEETEKPVTEIPVELADDQSQNIYPAQEMTFNHHAEGSELHIKTFILPIKKKHERSLWSCSNCSCGFHCSTWPSCCLCKGPSCNCCSWPRCNCCKWSSCRCCKLPSSSSCCKWPSCSCLIRPGCSCCKWSNCSCCKWPGCSGCCKPSCSCCKWPSCSGGCKPSGSCCKWPSCSFSACPSCSGCSSALCCCWNSQRKRSAEGRHAEMKSSKRWYSCFLCCSSPC